MKFTPGMCSCLSCARIAHLSSVHPILDVRIFHKECKTLARAGCDVTLIASTNKSVDANGIRIMMVPKERSRLLRMTRAVWRLYGLARKSNAAVYHFHDPELIPIGVLLAATRHRVIYDVHEDLPKDILDKAWIPRKARRVISVLVDFAERAACLCFSAVVAADDSIRSRLSSTVRQSITLHNYPLACEFEGINRRRPAQSVPSVFVNFGGIHSFRAIRPLVDAFGLLPSSVPVRLVLGGSCDSDSLLEELKEKPGWQRVDYRGQISRSEMLGELSSASGALVLYNNVPNNHSIRSNRFYEAIAAGLPIIAPSFGDWPKVVKGNQCGLTVDPENANEIAAAIMHLYSHPDEAAAMSRNGRNLFLKQFNWERESEKLLGLYRVLLNSSSSQLYRTVASDPQHNQ